MRFQGAASIDDAVGQFYENPNKHAQSSAISKSNPVKQDAKDNNNTTYDPPPYAPPKNTARAVQRRPHTNAVVEAGHVRARDEVCFVYLECM
jgi:hypothetical protein